MNCEQAREQVTAHLLGDLDPKTAAEIRGHLEKCDGCRAIAREVEPTLDLLRDALAATSSKAPAQLSPEHRRKIRTETVASRKSYRKLIRWLTVSHPRMARAAVIVFVLGFLWVGSGRLMWSYMGEMYGSFGAKLPAAATSPLSGPIGPFLPMFKMGEVVGGGGGEGHTVQLVKKFKPRIHGANLEEPAAETAIAGATLTAGKDEGGFGYKPSGEVKKAEALHLRFAEDVPVAENVEKETQLTYAADPLRIDGKMGAGGGAAERKPATGRVNDLPTLDDSRVLNEVNGTLPKSGEAEHKTAPAGKMGAGGAVGGLAYGMTVVSGSMGKPSASAAPPPASPGSARTRDEKPLATWLLSESSLAKAPAKPGAAKPAADTLILGGIVEKPGRADESTKPALPELDGKKEAKHAEGKPTSGPSDNTFFSGNTYYAEDKAMQEVIAKAKVLEGELLLEKRTMGQATRVQVGAVDRTPAPQQMVTKDYDVRPTVTEKMQLKEPQREVMRALIQDRTERAEEESAPNIQIATEVRQEVVKTRAPEINSEVDVKMGKLDLVDNMEKADELTDDDGVPDRWEGRRGQSENEKRAVAAYRDVLRKYPNSPEATVAHKELESMGVKIGGGVDADGDASGGESGAAGQATGADDNKAKAYAMWKKLAWEYPESSYAKYARGRLTEPALAKEAKEEEGTPAKPEPTVTSVNAVGYSRTKEMAGAKDEKADERQPARGPGANSFDAEERAVQDTIINARVLEGQLRLQQRKYENATRVEIGSGESQPSVVPGKPLKVQLKDRSLAVVGKASEVEVRVWTDSGDEEFLRVLPFGDTKDQFQGQIQTVAGPTTKGDGKLQVLGGDRVHYDYSDRYKKRNGITDTAAPADVAAAEKPAPVEAVAKKYGGTATPEGSVTRSLRWLKESQSKDGSWNGKVEDTSVGLLAYLAHGETPVSEEYGATTEKAIKSLLEAQRPDGRFSDDPEVNAKATYALNEAYGMTKHPVIRDAAEKATQAVIDDQAKSGKITGWDASALHSARLAGLETETLKTAMKDAADRLKKADAPDAAMGLQILGHGADKETREKLQALEKSKFELKDGGIDDMFFTTQAKFHAGGETWTKWNKEFAPELAKEQVVVQGAAENGRDTGYWKTDGKGDKKKSDAYNTAVASLMQEVYYRYLPTYKAPEEPAPEPGNQGVVRATADTPVAQVLSGKAAERESTGPALMKEADAYVENGNLAKADALLAKVFQDYPDAAFLDSMLLKWVVVSYGLGDFQKAKEKCQQLLFEYPSSLFATKAKQLLPKIEEQLAKAAKPSDGDLTGPRFKAAGVNPFVKAEQQAFSTFSIGVDTASYTLMRNYMLKGYLPPAEAVRTEEFVNFFDYAYKAPTRETFRIFVETAPSKFGHGLHLMKIGIKGRRLGREEQRKAMLTFLVDTSGSMDKADRIGLVKKSLKLLVEKMGPQDMVAIVQYDSHARLVLEFTPVSDKKKILAAIDALQCGGSTNLEEGMMKAYELAAKNFKPGGESRVLLLSDGVANLGNMAAADILKAVEAYRKQGIYCSVFGVGMGTYDDTMLQTLAAKGDGTYAFLDSEEEAKRVFVDDLSATLNTIAKDVKIQVEFNPKAVALYRQLGYESRQLKKEDFRNDAVDAGEVGSGQSVTALYELQRMQDAGYRMPEGGADPIATVRVRYRRTDNDKVEEIEQSVKWADVARSFDAADTRFRLAACVAEYSEILRGSPFAAGNEFKDVADVLRPVALELELDSQVQELLRLVSAAGGLSRAPVNE